MARKLLLYMACTLVLLVFIPGFARIQELGSRNKYLLTRIKEVKQENLTLRQEIDKLNTDSVYLESVARDKMGIVKKGEVIYHIVESENKKNQ